MIAMRDGTVFAVTREPVEDNTEARSKCRTSTKQVQEKQPPRTYRAATFTSSLAQRRILPNACIQGTG